MKSAIVAYIPVLHQGYLNFLNSHAKNADSLFIFTQKQIADYRSLVKDIRAVEPKLMIEVLETLFPELEPRLLDNEAITKLKESGATIITPDDEIFLPLLKQLFPENPVATDSIFLRWDKKRSLSRSDLAPDEEVSSKEFDQKIMSRAARVAEKSSDWWRQVASVLVSPSGEVLLEERNRHLPHDYQQYSDGDPRAEFQSGENIEVSSSIHAESQLIAKAAGQGITTKDCSLYVTTFPCPVCAKLVAQTGIKKVFYKDGYALLDGENILKSAGIKIIRVVD